MKACLHYLTPFWMVALRFGLSLPVIALVVAISHRCLPRFDLRDWPVIIGVSLLQFVGQMSVVTLALQWVPASSATILVYTTPLWLMLIDLLLDPESISARRAAASTISAAGCALILLASGRSTGLGPLGLILFAALLWSLSMRLISSHRWNGDVRDALFWQFLLATLIIVPVAWMLEGPPQPSAFAFPGIVFLLFIGPIASGAGFGMMVFAGRSLQASRVAQFGTLSPLIGFVTSALFLGEVLHPAIVVGGLAILSALLLNTKRSR